MAGLANRLALLVESEAGAFLEPSPEGEALDLGEAIEEGAVVCFSLDSSRYPGLAAQVGTLVVQDLKSIVGAALHGARRPFYVCVDEFSALDGDQLLGLVARGAGAGARVILATQELADLASASPSFKDQVLGSTALKAAFRQDVAASAEEWAVMAGTRTSWAETIQLTHRSAGLLVGATGGATGVAAARQAEVFRCHPNVVKSLPQGRCLLIRKHPRFAVSLIDVVPAPARGASR